jgi:hypothetical protein
MARPECAGKTEKTARADNAARNGIKRPIGIGKRRYRFGRIMAKLRCTAESVIAMQGLLQNPDSRVRFFGDVCCIWSGTLMNCV